MTDIISPEKWPGLQARISRIPYLQFLGAEFHESPDGPLATLPFLEQNIGNVTLPALHGGAIGSFLEMVAIAKVYLHIEDDIWPKPIDIQIDYLRSGKPLDTHASAEIIKLGRRAVNIQVFAWQDKKDKPIAALKGHFLVSK